MPPGPFAQDRNTVNPPPRPGELRFKSPEIHPDRRVTFRFFAPGAFRVLVGGGNLAVHAMEKGDDGIWVATIGPLEPDLYSYGFSVDGTVGIPDPMNSDIVHHERAADSLLDVHGEVSMFHDVRDVPHGSLHEHWFESEWLSETRHLIVYTPPGYDPDGDVCYPVLYLLHGGRNNETSWISSGRVNFILDNMLAEGKAVPMIIVLPYSYGRGGYGGSGRDRNIRDFAHHMVTDILPFVEKNYRTCAVQTHRAIAGFSVGAAQARTIGFNHLDLFGNIGLFSGGKRLDDDWKYTTGKLLADLKDVKDKLEVFWMAGAKHEPVDSQPSGGRSDEFAAFFISNDIPYSARPDRFGHSMQTCRHILSYDFLPKLFLGTHH